MMLGVVAPELTINTCKVLELAAIATAPRRAGPFFRYYSELVCLLLFSWK